MIIGQYVCLFKLTQEFLIYWGVWGTPPPTQGKIYQLDLKNPKFFSFDTKFIGKILQILAFILSILALSPKFWGGLKCIGKIFVEG